MSQVKAHRLIYLRPGIPGALGGPGIPGGPGAKKSLTIWNTSVRRGDVTVCGSQMLITYDAAGLEFRAGQELKKV